MNEWMNNYRLGINEHDKKWGVKRHMWTPHLKKWGQLTAGPRGSAAPDCVHTALRCSAGR